ncbi:hypothetical protein HDU97_009130 [Phlyctochytrium planicorne]|nr:hypothetical protein HDU97_009130 [Phlyctochytrium planicorne]
MFTTLDNNRLKLMLQVIQESRLLVEAETQGSPPCLLPEPFLNAPSTPTYEMEPPNFDFEGMWGNNAVAFAPPMDLRAQLSPPIPIDQNFDNHVPTPPTSFLSFLTTPDHIPTLGQEFMPHTTITPAPTPAAAPLPPPPYLATANVNATLPSLNLSKTAKAIKFHCDTCNIALGAMIFHLGTEAKTKKGGLASAENVTIKVTCNDCEVFPLNSITSSRRMAERSAAPSKKRKHKGVIGSNANINCEACSQRIGFGGAKVLDPFGRDDEASEALIRMEPICRNCVCNFDYCTQCGGGGTFRTGKWRPRQLFNTGRKTCNLAHERIGLVSHFQIATYECPTFPVVDESGAITHRNFDPSPTIFRSNSALGHTNDESSKAFPLEPLLHRLEEIQADGQSGRWLSHVATPARMAFPSMTWDMLIENWNSMLPLLDKAILGRDPDYRQPADFKRYLAVADGAPTSSRKLVPLKRKYAHITPGNMEADAICNPCWNLVGHFFMEWSPSARTLHMMLPAYFGKDSVEDGPRSAFYMMILMMLKRIQEDMTQYNHPSPDHIWTSFTTQDAMAHQRMISQLHHLGFISIEDYWKDCGGARRGLADGLSMLRRGLWSPVIEVDHAQDCVLMCSWDKLVTSFSLRL